MRRFTLSLIATATLAITLPSVRVAAELVWTPQTGWRVEGGALSAITDEAGRSALDLMNKARSQEESRNHKEARKLYIEVSKKYPNSIYAAEALYRAARLYLERDQYFKSFETFQQLVMRYPNSEKFIQVIGEQYRIASMLAEGKRSKIFGVIPGFKNREKSLEYFETIVRTAPYSDYAPLALMNAAHGYKNIRETEAAIDALDRMINTYPRSVLTPDAYLKIAQTHASLVDGPYYDQASTKEAVTYYEDYMILFPGDSGMATAEKGLDDMKVVLAKSKLTIADYYYKYRKNYKAARVFYNEAITVYPDSDVAATARAKLADVDAKLEEQAAAASGQPTTAQPANKKKRFGIF